MRFLADLSMFAQAPLEVPPLLLLPPPTLLLRPLLLLVILNLLMAFGFTVATCLLSPALQSSRPNSFRSGFRYPSLSAGAGAGTDNN